MIRREHHGLLAVLAIAAVFGIANSADAQAVEGRIDVLTSNPAAIHAAGGFTLPLGTYVRSGIDAGIGSSRNGVSGRVDFVNRFHLDPFRQHKWAPYAGGGLTARFDADRHGRAYLLVFVGLDAPASRGIGTSIEAGLGGGGRIGVVIRRTRTERR